jgi:hypothetical protein
VMTVTKDAVGVDIEGCFVWVLRRLANGDDFELPDDQTFGLGAGRCREPVVVANRFHAVGVAMLDIEITDGLESGVGFGIRVCGDAPDALGEKTVRKGVAFGWVAMVPGTEIGNASHVLSL